MSRRTGTDKKGGSQHTPLRKRKQQHKPSVLTQVRRLKLEQIHQSARAAGDDEALLAQLVTEAPSDVEEEDQPAAAAAALNRTLSSKRAFGSQLKKAITEADVVIEVLDARDPNSFRSEDVERSVLSNGKLLVLLLNKIDLVGDQSVVERWQKFLQRSHPCVVFRSMTTDSRSKKSSVKFTGGKATKAPSAVLESGYQPLGAADLMNLLKNYTRADNDDPPPATPPATDQVMDESSSGAPAPAPAPGRHFKSITVCVIGMPNVGKSSVINSLCRNTRKLKTGNEPGVTRHLGRVRLTDNIMLLDTPGVIFDGEDDDPRSILRGCSKATNDDAILSCVEILASQLSSKLMDVYKLEGFSETLSAEQLLTHIALTRGFKRQGGQRDLIAAGKCVIEDWKNGRFSYWVEPPAAPAASLEFVSAPSAALDLDNLPPP